MPAVLQGFHAAAKNMELPPLQTAATEVIYTLQGKKKYVAQDFKRMRWQQRHHQLKSKAARKHGSS